MVQGRLILDDEGWMEKDPYRAKCLIPAPPKRLHRVRVIALEGYGRLRTRTQPKKSSDAHENGKKERKKPVKINENEEYHRRDVF